MWRPNVPDDIGWYASSHISSRKTVCPELEWICGKQVCLNNKKIEPEQNLKFSMCWESVGQVLGTGCLPHFFFATIRSGFVHVNGCALVGEGGSITARGKLEGGEK